MTRVITRAASGALSSPRSEAIVPGSALGSSTSRIGLSEHPHERSYWRASIPGGDPSRATALRQHLSVAGRGTVRRVRPVHRLGTLGDHTPPDLPPSLRLCISHASRHTYGARLPERHLVEARAQGGEGLGRNRLRLVHGAVCDDAPVALEGRTESV